jgi:uncharacterized protein (DUF2147 family)
MPKTKKASVLAYSLIIIAMMLAIVASLSAATILSKKGSSATDASVQAYQTADSGVQLAIKTINGDLNATISDSFSDCDSGVIKNQNDAGAGQYTLSFYDSSDNQIFSCSALVNSISSIKSVGVYKDTVRAVNVAMAAEINIPTGAVVAFDLDDCPSGWQLADGSSAAGNLDLRGMFIRGLDDGRGADPDSSRNLGSTQSDDFKSHNHNSSNIWFNAGCAYTFAAGGYCGSPSPLQYQGGSETRPKNVALIYCIKKS